MSKKTNKVWADLFIANNKFRITQKHVFWNRKGVEYNRKYRQAYMSKFYIPPRKNIYKSKDEAVCLLRDILIEAGHVVPKKQDVSKQNRIMNEMTVLAQFLFNAVVPLLLEEENFSNSKRKEMHKLELRFHKDRIYWPDGIGDNLIKRVVQKLETLNILTVDKSSLERWADEGFSLPSLVVPHPEMLTNLVKLGVLTTKLPPFSGTSITPSSPTPPRTPPSIQETSSREQGEFLPSPAFIRVMEGMQWYGDVVQKPTFYLSTPDGEEPVEPNNIPEHMMEVVQEILYSNSYTGDYNVLYNNGSLQGNHDRQLRVKLGKRDGEITQWNFGRTSCPFVTMDKGQKSHMFFHERIEETKAVEVDLSSLYPTLFMMESGIDLRASYNTLTSFLMLDPSWDAKLDKKATRAISKKIINSIIVSECQELALKSIRQQVNFSTKVDDEGYRLSAEQVMYKIYNLHPGLKDKAFKLNWIDKMTDHETRLMSRIRNELISLDIPFLSCYDAVWVPKMAEKEAQKIMDKEYKNYLKELK